MLQYELNIDEVIKNIDFKALAAFVAHKARKAGQTRYKFPADMHLAVCSFLMDSDACPEEPNTNDINKIYQVLSDLGIAKRIYTPKHIKHGRWSTFVFEIYYKV